MFHVHMFMFLFSRYQLCEIMAVPIYDGYISYLLHILGVMLAAQVVYNPHNTEHNGVDMPSPIQVEYDPLNLEYYTFYA